MRARDLEPPDLFRAFADATRLRLLNLLLEREICVCDLCEILGEIQPKVSRHLAILRRESGSSTPSRRSGRRCSGSFSAASGRACPSSRSWPRTGGNWDPWKGDCTVRRAPSPHPEGGRTEDI